MDSSKWGCMLRPDKPHTLCVEESEGVVVEGGLTSPAANNKRAINYSETQF